MKSMIVVNAKFLSATKHKPTRLKLNIPRWDNKGKEYSITHLNGEGAGMIEHLFLKNNIDPESFGMTKEGWAFMVSFDYCSQLSFFIGGDPTITRGN